MLKIVDRTKRETKKLRYKFSVPTLRLKSLNYLTTITLIRMLVQIMIMKLLYYIYDNGIMNRDVVIMETGDKSNRKINEKFDEKK